MLILLFKQIYINLDEYNDADYVNFDIAQEAQWNESEGFENSLCTDHRPIPPPPHRKNRGRGVCDSPLLIVYVGHVIFPKLWKIIWLAITDGSLHHKWRILIGFRVSRQT